MANVWHVCPKYYADKFFGHKTRSCLLFEIWTDMRAVVFFTKNTKLMSLSLYQNSNEL